MSVTNYDQLHHINREPPTGEASIPHQANTEPLVVSSKPTPSAGLLVYQACVYGFWGSTILLIGSLLAVICYTSVRPWDLEFLSKLSHAFYLVAVTIVVFIISLCLDLFYARAERSHANSRGSTAIRIVYTAFFSLCAVAALGVAVIATLSMFITSPIAKQYAGGIAVSSTVLASVYGCTVLRTVRPRWIRRVPLMYWISMTIVVLITAAIMVRGPIASAQHALEDRPVETAAQEIARAVDRYTVSNFMLPNSLTQLQDLSSNAIKQRDNGTITYAPLRVLSTNRALIKEPIGGGMSYRHGIFNYKLCATYKNDTRPHVSGKGFDASKLNDQDFTLVLDNRYHAKGTVCYQLQTSYVYNE